MNVRTSYIAKINTGSTVHKCCSGINYHDSINLFQWTNVLTKYTNVRTVPVR